jgi:hypothetical protein
MDTTVPSGWQAIGSSTNSTTRSQVTQYIRGTAGSTAPLQGVQCLDVTASATGNNGAAVAITNPASWKILIVTKATGTATPRMHVFPLGGAWTHQNADSSNSNPATQSSGHFYVGAYADPGSGTLGDFCNMRVALYATWAGTALSDAECEALASGLATSAWTGHSVTPTTVWEFTQASTATAVEDLIGSADQTSIAGTSVVTTDDPAGWTFAGGAAPPVNTVAPVVSGTTTVGETLSCTTGTWTGDATITYGYQWQEDVAGNGSFSNISGATSSTYLLDEDQEGDDVRCVVTGTNGAGSDDANSNEVGPIAAADDPAEPNCYLMTAGGLVACVSRIRTAGGLFPPV